VRDGFREPITRLLEVLGVEDRPDQRREQPVLVLAGVAEAVSEEVNGAALPGAPQDLGDRRLQAGVRVTDGELDADQAAFDEASEELCPERLGLGFADVDREDLASPALMDAVGDDERLVDHAAAVADLLDLGVEEQVGVAALQRPGPERLDVLVQRLADAADLTLGDPQAQALHELVDTAGRDAADISLLDHRDERLLRTPPRLQEAREVAALADLGDLQLQLTGARVPPPRPIAVAMRRTIFGPALTALSADQLGHLKLHHLRRDGLDRLADHVSVLIEQHLPDDLLDRHPVGTGHAGASFHRRTLRSPPMMSAGVAGTTLTAVPSDPLLHQP